MAKHQDKSGETFGRLLVLHLHHKTDKGNYFWSCRCECGNLCTIPTSSLNKVTRSCGCIKREQLVERNSSHGLAHTPIYNVWSSMKARCDLTSNKSYKDYGGRGISYCDSWKTFENFYSDMGESYKEWLTIERIDNGKGYYKENCKWVDRFEQASNTRKNKFVTYDGVTLTQSQMARKYGIMPQVLNKRLKLGWEVKRALGLTARV